MSFGQAAYACQPALSWQTTVVGDPLYRPFGKNPDILKDELARRNSKLLEWYFLRLLNVNLVAGKPIAEGVQALEKFENTKRSAVLTEKLADLYAALGKPASAAHAYQEVLKLDPSPQQRIRVLLAIGAKLTATENYTEAYQAYQTILQENPDYPDKEALYKFLLPLAHKLNKKADAETYQTALESTGASSVKK
jgi:tetratricopeptide (TPR) repeat protein